MSYNTPNYEEQGGSRLVIGGELDIVSGGAFKIAGVDITDELAKLDGLSDELTALETLGDTTATAAELNTLDGVPASMTTATTPASGSCAVQFVLKDTAGVTMARKASGLLYASNSTGLAVAGVTGLAVLTNGALTELSVGKVAHVITTAAGLLGVTVTAAAGTYYLSLVLPNGNVITSSALVVNA